MPVTAKLSKKFYDKLGEEIADELVNWFNAVDATYRADLRELNELNFQRFDAKLEQRLAELRADMRLEMGESKNELVRAIGEVRTALVALESRLVRWTFLFWAGTALAVIGLR